MVHARNVAIIAVLALGVAFLPGGGDVAAAVFAAITMAFLAAIAWTVRRVAAENSFTLMSLADSRRLALYGAVGLVVLLIAGVDRMWSTGPGTLLWLVLLAAAIGSVVWVWRDTKPY